MSKWEVYIRGYRGRDPCSHTAVPNTEKTVAQLNELFFWHPERLMGLMIRPMVLFVKQVNIILMIGSPVKRATGWVRNINNKKERFCSKWVSSGSRNEGPWLHGAVGLFRLWPDAEHVLGWSISSFTIWILCAASTCQEPHPLAALPRSLELYYPL